jgi:hypothetical protein
MNVKHIQHYNIAKFVKRDKKVSSENGYSL